MRGQLLTKALQRNEENKSMTLLNKNTKKLKYTPLWSSNGHLYCPLLDSEWVWNTGIEVHHQWEEYILFEWSCMYCVQLEAT